MNYVVKARIEKNFVVDCCCSSDSSTSTLVTLCFSNEVHRRINNKIVIVFRIPSSTMVHDSCSRVRCVSTTIGQSTCDLWMWFVQCIAYVGCLIWILFIYSTSSVQRHLVLLQGRSNDGINRHCGQNFVCSSER